MAHTYTPILRLTPLAGPTSTLAITGVAWAVKAQPSYEPIINQKEMLDRSLRQTRYGYRVHVALEFEYPTPSTDETNLALMLTQAVNDDSAIELSLDNGTTYRFMLLESFEQAPLADKNIGVSVKTSWVGRDLLTTKPAVVSGAW